ncbi:Tc5 transposase DNA-binding domain [Popillia japonica]|uniref:Tc5 transposase DNA-binding domain n=1 Tax=Popillia japonica TaxID=7064 RepID=A0AAW1LT22_POPJA
MLLSIKEVAENQRSIRPVAEEYGINFMTLQRYVKKYEKAGPNEGNKISTGYLKNRQILTPFQENELAVYVIECSRIYHGVSPKDLRQLAYQFARKNNVVVPDNWIKSESASSDWLTGFLKRHRHVVQ